MTTPALLLPKATAVVVAWLSPRLTPVHVGTKVPSPRPSRLVKVRRVGGILRSMVLDQPMMLFECWADSSPAAEDLCRSVRGQVWAMDGQIVLGAWCSSINEIAGPVDFPDPDSDQPRWTYTAQLSLRQIGE